MSISAKDLVTWANSYTARFTLPQLLRRLVLASAKGTKKLRLPSDEEVSRPGYDGVVQVQQGNGWVPSGLSVWEMGVDKNPATKAEKDYLKRNRKPEIRRSTATFVFVTPRDWLDREEWCRRKARGKKWKAVKALDCSDLAEWLDSVPSVAFWAGRLLGKRPQGVCDITARWQNIRDLSNPKLLPEVFLAGRDSETNAITEWLTRAPDVFFLEVDSADEAVDFFCAFALSKPGDKRLEEARGVIVETREAFRELSASTTPLILVAAVEIEPELLREATRQGHHVLAAVPQGPQPTQGAQRLRRLQAYGIEKALVKATFDFQRARRIARESGGSSVVLKRLVVSGPNRCPKWAAPAVAHKAAPFLLAGGWDDSNAEDRRLVSEITGLERAEVRAFVQEWSRSADPLFRRKENTWRLVSRVDSWRWLSSYLDQRAVDEYAKHFPQVLAVDDPRFELRPEQRIMASVLGKKLNYSATLRKGMAEAYTLFSVTDDSSIAIATTEVNIQIGKLFQAVFPPDMTWRRWASLGDALELFAEASPDEFLNVLERELSKNPPSPASLFPQEDSFSGSPVVGLMWALEILGWQPNYLLRAALCLADLAELDPGGNWNPRPFGVLTGFFHPRLPQTTASIERRFEVLDEILKAKPITGWRLLLELLPKSSRMLIYNHHPRWRSWSEGWLRGIRPNAEVAEEFDLLADRLVSVAENQPRRLVELLKHISHFKAAARNRLLDALRGVDATILDDATRESLANSLAEFINDTRRNPPSCRALPKKIIDELGTIVTRIQPEDLCLRHRWLFHPWPQLPGLSQATPLHAREKAIAKAQAAALAEIAGSGGLSFIRRMAEESTAPWIVGKTLAKTRLAADTALLPTWLGDSNPNIVRAAQAFARIRFDSEGWAWVQSFRTSIWKVNQIANLGLALPFEPKVWDFLKTHSDAAADDYWKLSSGYNRALGLCDHERAVREWLARKRPGSAAELLFLILDEHKPSTALVLETLEVLLVSAATADVQSEVASGGSRIRKLIEYVQDTPLNDNSRVRALEWSFLPLLLQAGGSPRTLLAALTSQPNFFVELVGTIYRQNNQGEQSVTELTQQEKHRADLAWQLLDECRVLPGTQLDGIVTEMSLRNWAEGVREEARAQNLEEVADYRMGELFAHAPVEIDNVWPCVPVRKIIEDWKSEALEAGMRHKRFNDFQPDAFREPAAEKTWGGLARKHRKHAEALAGKWSRTAALLRELADLYEGIARRHERDRFFDD